MTPEYFRRILTREEHGFRAWSLRLLLEIIRPFYALGVWLRNRKFDRCPQNSFHADVPVLSIGNLTLGGTGKSPFVLRTARELERLGLKVAVLSRGYHAKKQNSGLRKNDLLNDEGKEMASRLPNVIFLQNPNRSEIARRAVEEFGAEVILLDDGFQHRKLFRNVDFLLIDAQEPFGLTGRLFPCGTLREPPREIRRADILVLTHANRMNPRERHSLQEELTSRFPGKKNRLWLETIHRPAGFSSSDGKFISIDDFQKTFAGKKIGAFCGVGKPDGFFQSLAECRVDAAEKKIYPDHHRFDERDSRQLLNWAKENDLDLFLCTEKDMVKLPDSLTKSIPVLALRIEIFFLSGEESFRDFLKNQVKKLG